MAFVFKVALSLDDLEGKVKPLINLDNYKLKWEWL